MAKTVIKDSNGSLSAMANMLSLANAGARCQLRRSQKFQITPMDGTARDIYFGQTHLAANKSTSGDSDMGNLTNDLLSASDMKVASNYSAFDSIWSIVDGKVPSLLGAIRLRGLICFSSVEVSRLRGP
jgi:hypothetical protein